MFVLQNCMHQDWLDEHYNHTMVAFHALLTTDHYRWGFQLPYTEYL